MQIYCYFRRKSEWKYMKIYETICKYMQIYESICKYMKIYANIWKHIAILGENLYSLQKKKLYNVIWKVSKEKVEVFDFKPNGPLSEFWVVGFWTLKGSVREKWKGV